MYISKYDYYHVYVTLQNVLSIRPIGVYTISWYHCFHVPGCLEDFIWNCFMMLNDSGPRGVTGWDWNTRSCKIGSMIRLGLYDGGFRRLESLNTLLFIDFYLNAVIVISLLLM